MQKKIKGFARTENNSEQDNTSDVMSMGSIGAYKGKRAAHKTALKVNVIEMQEKN